jgi:molybdopterin/thiamine biosynthesis adenylyltransferase
MKHGSLTGENRQKIFYFVVLPYPGLLDSKSPPVLHGAVISKPIRLLQANIGFSRGEENRVVKYEDVFARNMGLFSPVEQDRLRSATVLVAGVGGVGGIQAATLARFGIGKLILIDPGEFDPPDMNRQYGATCSTMGRNKAEAMTELLKDVNPFLIIDWHGGRPSPELLGELVAESSIIVDGIDFTDLEYKILLARTARKAGLLNLTGPIPDFDARMIFFDPQGMIAEEFYGAPESYARPPNRTPFISGGVCHGFNHPYGEQRTGGPVRAAGRRRGLSPVCGSR